jgi:hypothetical protein
MYIPESEYRLEDTCCMCVDFLNSIEGTFTDAPRECGYLVDTDDTCICDDEEIELIVDPVEEDKSQKYNPKERYGSPKESSTRDRYDTISISKQESSGDDQYEHVDKVKQQYYPMSVKRHYEAFTVSEEGDVFLFDHVMCGALK